MKIPIIIVLIAVSFSQVFGTPAIHNNMNNHYGGGTPKVIFYTHTDYGGGRQEFSYGNKWENLPKAMIGRVSSFRQYGSCIMLCKTWKQHCTNENDFKVFCDREVPDLSRFQYNDEVKAYRHC